MSSQCINFCHPRFPTYIHNTLVSEYPEKFARLASRLATRKIAKQFSFRGCGGGNCNHAGRFRRNADRAKKTRINGVEPKHYRKTKDSQSYSQTINLNHLLSLFGQPVGNRGKLPAKSSTGKVINRASKNRQAVFCVALFSSSGLGLELVLTLVIALLWISTIQARINTYLL